jgi:hypothetical protein
MLQFSLIEAADAIPIGSVDRFHIQSLRYDIF